MKYKTLGAVAHNFAHSFASALNYAGDDYVMSHLAHAALGSGVAELRVDLVTGRAEPRALLTPPVRAAIRGRVERFPAYLARHAVPRERVRAAHLVVRFALEQRSPLSFSGGTGRWEAPFVARMTIVDDRGVEHVGEVRDRWATKWRPGRVAQRWLWRLWPAQFSWRVDLPAELT